MDPPTVANTVDMEKDTSTASNAMDMEKDMAPTESTPPDISISESTPVTGFAKWNQKIESLAGLESRGISRVLPHERSPPSNFHYIQMASIWFSANLTANNLALGLLGPLVYELSFTDSALCAVFGAVIGSAATAYMGIWGAESGNRTLVQAYTT